MSKLTIIDDGPFTLYCPKCGSEEWDRITNRIAPGEGFQRCARCDNEWQSDQLPKATGWEPLPAGRRECIRLGFSGDCRKGRLCPGCDGMPTTAAGGQ